MSQRKRLKLDNGDIQKPKANSTNLFAPFRALGIVSTKVPFAYQLRTSKGSAARPSLVIVTATGKQSWALWSEDALHLKMVSERFAANEAEEITCIDTYQDLVYASTSSSIHIFKRGKIVGRLLGPLKSNISQFIVLGIQIIALNSDGSEMYIWTTDTMELYSTITFPSGFVATTIQHPATYVNKVVIGSQTGSLAIYNIQTGTLIHTFLSKDILPQSKRLGSITAIEQSPEIDILAIGHSSGVISLFDIRTSHQLMQIIIPSSRPNSKPESITSISFRTDNVQHLLAASTTTGLISVFDLDSGPDQTLQPGRLVHSIKAHSDSVSKIAWIQGQPLLISSSGDNSFKQWFFDQATGPRLLKSRQGHQRPVSKVRYYGNDGKAILSCSEDALRYTSVVRDSRSTALSTSQTEVPLVDKMAWNTAKRLEWDDLITISHGEKIARTWSVQNKKLGKHVFDLGSVNSSRKKEREDLGLAKAVEISACGNFAFVGYSSSLTIGMWNLQSGLQRRMFIIPSTYTASTSSMRDREQHISGIATDSLNRLVVVSTLSGSLHFFDFHTTNYLQHVKLPAAITALHLFRTNNLLACICDDLCIRIIDIETRRTVRELSAFRGQILDMAFSNDGRWLVVTSADSVIRTFDLPTGRLIDAFRTPTIANSLSFSPTGDFLATSHVGSNGVYIWANRAQFTHVSMKSYEEEDVIPIVELPYIQGDEEEGPDLTEVESEDALTMTGPSKQDQLSAGLLSLSLLPRSKWQTLLNLDVIRARNKPVEPPKAPERAPFFLPTIPGTNTQTTFDMSQAGSHSHLESNSRSLVRFAEVESEVMRALDHPSDDYEHFFTLLINLPPSTLDLEIRSIPSNRTKSFVDALTARLLTAKDFEALQSIISVFLSSQREALLGNEVEPELVASLDRLMTAQKQETTRLHALVGYCLGSLAFIRNLPVA